MRFGKPLKGMGKFKTNRKGYTITAIAKGGDAL